MSYQLTPVVINPNTPAWKAQILPYEQAASDKTYLNALAVYDQAVANWLNANTVGRANSSDPANYIPTPFTAQVPLREVLDSDSQGNETSTMHDDMVNPRPHPPSLPAWVAPAPPVQPSTGAPAADAQNSAALTAIINLLLQIKTKLGA